MICSSAASSIIAIIALFSATFLLAAAAIVCSFTYGSHHVPPPTNFEPPAIRELTDTGAAAAGGAAFADQQPVVLRSLSVHWPAVQAGLRSTPALVRYLAGFDNGRPVDALLAPPEVRGEIGYDPAMSGFNFARNRLPLSAVVEQVLRYTRFSAPPAVAAQSALISDCLPGFERANGLDMLPHPVAPRIWLGNRISTPIHLDEWNNVGCVVAGRRRITLFPPDQIGNLYIGPLDFAPTGAAMSLVSLHRPDRRRFPRFTQAFAAAQSAILDPGDAIYIPPLWWHHVESLDPFNVFVNYWWHESAGEGSAADSAVDALLHAILAIRRLPAPTRRAWSALYEHYVFAAQDAAAHIPPARQGLLGKLGAAQAVSLRTHLAKRLQRPGV